MNKALKLLLLSESLIILSAAMLGPIYALYVEAIGGGILEASWAVGTYSFVTGIVLYAFSKFEDKMKEKELALVLGYFILGIGYFSYLLVHSISTLLITQVILGLGSAIYVPAYDGLYSIHLNRRKAASQWGTWEMMANIITAVGAILGGILAAFFGFPIIFIAMGLLCWVSALIIWNQPRKLL